MNALSLSPDRRHADVIVIGGGLVGLCCTVALANRGIRVTLLGHPLPGEASPAAAGMLAPDVELGQGAAHAFAIAARDRYPALVAMLEARTRVRVPLDRQGILQIALDDRAAEALKGALHGDARWLEAAELRNVEPGLVHAVGAAHHLTDGSVDNVSLLAALGRLVESDVLVTVDRRLAIRVDTTDTAASVTVSGGEKLEAGQAVLAAGSWAGQLDGLPRRLPVEPVRGQMLAKDGAPVRHVTYGPHGYIVPRGTRETLVGATMERVGFDPSLTDEAALHLASVAEEICPALGSAPTLRRWCGLRPVTPDFEPIIGRDPSRRRLIYACGHSRNGILLAPLTGDCVAAIAAEEEPPYDLRPFRVDRFANLARTPAESR